MSDQVTEEFAKVVYEAMRWALKNPRHGGGAPEWQEYGNSFAQDRAREAAAHFTLALAAAVAGAEADLCRWRAAFQACTPGGSEFMTPESTREYMQNLKREMVEAKLEVVRLRKAAIRSPEIAQAGEES